MSDKMKRKEYEAELRRLHAELVAMQEWVKATGAKVCVVFEGRDTAGRPCLELLDTRTDAVLPGFERDEAAAPRFVSGTEIWFRDVSGGAGAIVSLDVERRTEAPTGLTGVVSDVRQIG